MSQSLDKIQPPKIQPPTIFKDTNSPKLFPARCTILWKKFGSDRDFDAQLLKSIYQQGYFSCGRSQLYSLDIPSSLFSLMAIKSISFNE
ncbi:hypothetical protein [Scytonema millei]|uniref:Uncharacterized protein n=1 Tax=Scytonema millei VB511283 TaxID=1245923 RepID=A0A9X5E0V6_9CYAN|nr:hypothetical protein [Scytonema millei]NHC33396.1 hypothetical protein [Scytonema millei VB511283]